MAKSMSTGMYNAGLNLMANTTTLSVLSTANPTSIADIRTFTLANTAVTFADFTFAAGDVSGRKLTVAAKSSVPIIASGSANTVALDDGTDFVVTDISNPQALTANGTVTIGTWAREILAPA